MKFQIIDGDNKVRGKADTVKLAEGMITKLNEIESVHPRSWFKIKPIHDGDSLLDAPLLEAKLDGFRVYKIKDRLEKHPYRDRKYTAPVYVMGLPGDIDLFNEELALGRRRN